MSDYANKAPLYLLRSTHNGTRIRTTEASARSLISEGSAVLEAGQELPPLPVNPPRPADPGWRV